MPDDTLNRHRAEAIFGQVTDAARTHGVHDIEAIIGGSEHALTRFANNAIHQNVAEREVQLSVRPIIGKRTARASTNRLDTSGIREVVETAVAITRLTEPDEELLPMAEPGETCEVRRWYEATARATPQERALAVAKAIAAIEDKGQNAAGIFSTGTSFFALLNSRGISDWYNETMARFSITAMTGDSSGWAKESACYHGDLDPLALAMRAAAKADCSRQPKAIPAGRYTVVLEPAAVLDLVGQMFGDFSATAIRDGRSFLTDRVGKKLFGDNVTIYDDCLDPLQAGAPFDGEGVPRRRLTLVERGEIRDIAYSRAAAAKAGVDATGHGFPLPNEIGEAPANIVIASGEASLEQMVRSTQRGILVTRFWYIREVDPYEKIFTGMTRDGTFLIEGGEITTGVRNFRFNQSLIELLSNVAMLSPAMRASGEESIDMVVPAMKVEGFNFTEVTRF
jgi:predicted Zn-dependent protease